MRDDRVAYVVAHLGDAPAVLVMDETGFLKQGTESVGVKRQDRGTAGRVENCQIGVCLTSASPGGHALLDRALPASGVGDRRRAAGVPEEGAFATKPALARQLRERARWAGVPAAWVTGEGIYGGDRRWRVWLEQQEQPVVLEVACNEPRSFHWDGQFGQPRADALAAGLPVAAWQRLSAGEGANGPRVYGWARVPLARLRLTAEERRCEHWRLGRRSLSDPTELACSVVLAPAGTSWQALVMVAGQRWRIAQRVELAKGAVGLAHDEVRRWDGWDRHLTLALFALAYLTVRRARLNGLRAPTGGLVSEL